MKFNSIDDLDSWSNKGIFSSKKVKNSFVNTLIHKNIIDQESSCFFLSDNDLDYPAESALIIHSSMSIHGYKCSLIREELCTIKKKYLSRYDIALSDLFHTLHDKQLFIINSNSWENNLQYNFKKNTLDIIIYEVCEINFFGIDETLDKLFDLLMDNGKIFLFIMKQDINKSIQVKYNLYIDSVIKLLDDNFLLILNKEPTKRILFRNYNKTSLDNIKLCISEGFNYVNKGELKSRDWLKNVDNFSLSEFDTKWKATNLQFKDFIELQKLYDFKYDYTYIKKEASKNSIVNVKCLEHNLSFETTLRNHLNGDVCPKCNFKTIKTSDKKISEVNKNDASNQSKDKKNIIENINHEELKTLIKDVQTGVDIINSKSDKILNLLSKLFGKVKEIKDKENDTEKSINKIIDLIDKDLEKRNINDYVSLVKKWFNYWELLEPDSKEFMPTSEFLFDKIKSSNFNDYSPFVLYYCRVLEYEILNKVFVKFHESMDKKYNDKSPLFKYDKESIENEKTIKEIENGPVNNFKRSLLSGKIKYTLGDMRLLKNTSKESKKFKLLLGLQELHKFINNEIGEIDKSLIKRIEHIILEYRNPSAHTGIIDIKKATDFYNKFKIVMNEIMKNFLNKK